MCLIRTYEEDPDYLPPRRVVHTSSHGRRRSISLSPTPPIVGVRRRISISPVRSIRDRLSRVSVEEYRPRRSSAHYSRRVASLPKPLAPPPRSSAHVVREVEVVRSDSISPRSSLSSTYEPRGRSHGSRAIKSYPVRDDHEYVVREASVARPKHWSPVRWNMDTSKYDRKRSRSRSTRGDLYVEEPRGSGIYRKESDRLGRYW